MMSIGGKSISIALRRSAEMLGIFLAIADFLGLVISRKKTDPALPVQYLLGLKCNTKNLTLALKDGKAEKTKLLIEESLEQDMFSIKNLQSIGGILN